MPMDILEGSEYQMSMGAINRHWIVFAYGCLLVDFVHQMPMSFISKHWKLFADVRLLEDYLHQMFMGGCW